MGGPEFLAGAMKALLSWEGSSMPGADRTSAPNRRRWDAEEALLLVAGSSKAAFNFVFPSAAASAQHGHPALHSTPLPSEHRIFFALALLAWRSRLDTCLSLMTPDLPLLK